MSGLRVDTRIVDAADRQALLGSGSALVQLRSDIESAARSDADDVREIVRRGLEQTQGSYRKLVELVHLPPNDYKRFLAFLSQHDCHLPFHKFRDSTRST